MSGPGPALLPAFAAALLAGCASVPPAAAPAPAAGASWIEAGGRRLHVYDSLPSGGRVTLLAVHGWGGTGCDFCELAPLLPEGVRLVAPDLPGSGRSPAGPGQRLDMELFVGVLRDLSRRMGLAPVVLVGHSLGGKIACAYAAAFPEECSRLVLIAPYGLPGQVRGFRGAVASCGALVRIGAALNNRAAVRMLLRRRVFYDRRLIPERMAEAEMESQLSAGGRRALAAVTSTMIGRNPIDGLLPSMRVPTLILWGRNDRVLPVEAASRFASLIPGARLELIDRCGHMPMAERPAETAAALGAWLTSGRTPAD